MTHFATAPRVSDLVEVVPADWKPAEVGSSLLKAVAIGLASDARAWETPRGLLVIVTIDDIGGDGWWMHSTMSVANARGRRSHLGERRHRIPTWEELGAV